MSLQKRVKKIRAKLHTKIKKNKAKYGIAALLAVFISSVVHNYDGYYRPHTPKEYAKTSVTILGNHMGGTGNILISNSNGSIILTNRHVCEGVKEGGIVMDDEGGKHAVQAYKMSEIHDLCEIKIQDDLGINTKVADHAPEMYSDAIISGHPHLYPHTVTRGQFSGIMHINVGIGERECTAEDLKDKRSAEECKENDGKIEVARAYEAQYVSATILPGSSGSAVFNSDGEIAGVAFASDSRELAYAFIVPQSYVKKFVDEEAPSMSWSQPQNQQLRQNHRIYMI